MADKNEDDAPLRQILAAGSTKALSELLWDPQVKAACLDTLAGLGCRPPANHLAFFCLSKLTLGTTSLLGTAAASRLEDWLLKVPAVKTLFLRLVALNRQESDREKLRHMLLAELRRGGTESPGLDIVTPPEVLAALYQKQKLEGLTAEFSDLLGALQDAVVRMLTDIDARDSEPALRWPEQHGAIETRSVSDTLRYNSRQYQFLGRDQEVDFLKDFLGDPSMAGPLAHFSWLLITGPGGEGKTRLAFEFSRLAEADLGWKSGRMSHKELENFDAARWRPRKPTCIMIDYPAQVPDGINALLSALQECSADFDWPVRVLMMEREAEGEWFKRLLPEGSDQSAILQHTFMYGGRRLEKGWELPPLNPGAAVQVMSDRFVSAGLEPPEPMLLLQAAHRIDSRSVEIGDKIVPVPRPLFAMAAAEALILEKGKNDTSYESLLTHLDREEVLSRLIERDREQRWKKAHRGNDKQTLALHENLYALATICLGLSCADLKSLPSHVLDTLPDLNPRGQLPLIDELIDTMSGGHGGTIPGLEPDILGEFFVLQRLLEIRKKHPDIAQAICDGAFAIGGDNCGIFVLRCVRDFPALTKAVAFLVPAAEAGNPASRLFAKLCVDLAAVLGEKSEWHDIDSLFNRLTAMRAAFPDDREIALMEAQAAVNVSNVTGGAGDWARVEAMLARLDALRAAFPDDREIALEEAKAAFNVSSDSGRASDWARVDAMLARLDALRAAFPDDREIALREAKTVFNVSSAAGRAGDWARLDALLARLDALRAAFPDDREFALREAQTAVNVSNAAGGAGDWARLDAMLARLDALRATFPDDREIALTEAQTAVNVSSDSGRASDWARVEAMLARLDALRAAFPDDREIALRDAKTVFNVSSAAGGAGDWARVEAMLARLDALRAAFPDDREFALEEAKAAVNVSSDSGGADDWARVDAMLARLDTLRATFPDDREFALEEAKAAANVGGAAGGAGDWARLDAMLARLDALRATFPDDREFALEEAKAAFNVSSDSGRASDWARVDAMLARLDALRAAFPDDREIALEEAKAAFNVSSAAGRAGDWARVEVTEGRALALLDTFGNDVEIKEVALCVLILGYWSRREAHSMLEQSFAIVATTAALALLIEPDTGSDRMRAFQAMSLRVIADAHALSPDVAEIRTIFERCEKSGVDFSQVPPLVPKDPTG